MLSNLNILLPYITIASHVVFGVLLFALIFRKTWGRGLVTWFGKNAYLFAFLATLSAVAGSLFYSEVIGFEPCVLCWWQRVFLYPLPLILGLALWKKKDDAFIYVIPLAALATLIALYHSYVYWGGTSILPCTAVGGACSKIYVMEFGYITIPTMSLTISLFVLLFAWASKIYRNENSNA